MLGRTEEWLSRQVFLRSHSHGTYMATKLYERCLFFNANKYQKTRRVFSSRSSCHSRRHFCIYMPVPTERGEGEREAGGGGSTTLGSFLAGAIREGDDGGSDASLCHVARTGFLVAFGAGRGN